MIGRARCSFWLGDVILELVGDDDTADPAPARLWGIALTARISTPPPPFLGAAPAAAGRATGPRHRDDPYSPARDLGAAGDVTHLSSRCDAALTCRGRRGAAPREQLQRHR
ncbi:MAG: hypothetical protein R2695_04720 [Acidimicrobiales bacterium]